MLFEDNLPRKFRAEAVNTAVHLRYRCTVSGLDKKTPYEMWFNRKPNITYFRVFGSFAMVHVPKERFGKWDKNLSRSFLLVMVKI